MFPVRPCAAVAGLSFPRVRGDVPLKNVTHNLVPLFSPRARGCSQERPYGPAKLIVFPACAGMFRLAFQLHALHACFPRVRGDVPILTN